MTSFINASTSSGVVTTADTSGSLALQTASTTALTIDSSQNVGIGTASPADKLDVTRVSSSNSTGGLTLTNTDNSGYGSSLNWNLKLNSTAGNWGRIYTESASTTATFMAFQTTVGSTLAERMRINSSGYVGIGLTSPSAPLNVQAIATNGLAMRINGRSADNYGELAFWNNANSTNYAIVGADAGAMYFGTNASLPVSIQASGTEYVRLLSSGVLIAGANVNNAASSFVNSNCKLQVYGTTGEYTQLMQNTSASGPYGLSMKYSGMTPNNASNQWINCEDSSAVRFKVVSNGGIYNFSANNTNISDLREKNNIELAPNYLDKICQIPVKTFLLNDQTDTDLNLGVIAQDVQAVCPELVTESNWSGKDEEPKMRLSIYQTDLQYALMKAIQELKAINDTQAETINALTARLVALESKA